MPDKKTLDDMLSQDLARPAIRRGKGVQLSTDAPTPEPLPTETQAVEPSIDLEAHKRTNAQTHNLEDARSYKRTSAQTHIDDAERVTRVSQGQRLRLDLIKKLKQIALDDNRKLYQVMEEAIEEYVERRRRDEQ